MLRALMTKKKKKKNGRCSIVERKFKDCGT
jgi:hypothetical protein